MWLHGNIRPTGAAKERRQSLLSVDNRSYRLSVLTLVGKSSVSLNVCKQSILSPTRTRSAPRRMSSKEACPSSEREKYLSSRPPFSFVPTNSSPVMRTILICSVSLMIRSNWSTASMNFITSSLLVISLGSRCPRQSEEKLLCCAIRCLFVLVRKR